MVKKGPWLSCLRNPKISLGLLVFLVSLLIYTLSLNVVWSTDHATSFLELDWALYSRHSFALGDVGHFRPQSVDDFAYNGRYYSAIAPGAAWFAFPFVAFGFLLEGQFTLYGRVMLFSEFFVALSNSIATYVVYRFGRNYFTHRTSIFLAFAYAFSTISWPFATYFFQSDISAMFVLAAAFLALRIGSGGKANVRNALLCGLALGAALTVDYVDAILIPIVLVYVVYSLRKKRAALLKPTIAFLLASFVGFLLIGLYDFASFGKPFISSEQLYLNSATPFGEFSFPLHLGLVLNLFTPSRGIFLYSPILALGVLGAYRMLRSRTFAEEAVFLLALFLGILLPYSAWYTPTGGLSFGPRFLVPALPFLLIPAGFVIESGTPAYFLYCVGVAINGIAGLTAAIAPERQWLDSPFTSTTLPAFTRGALDVWWAPAAGTWWFVPASLIIIAAAAIPAIMTRIVPDARRRDATRRVTRSLPFRQKLRMLRTRGPLQDNCIPRVESVESTS